MAARHCACLHTAPSPKRTGRGMSARWLGQATVLRYQAGGPSDLELRCRAGLVLADNGPGMIAIVGCLLTRVINSYSASTRRRLE
jgi:hypothetical protein